MRDKELIVFEELDLFRAETAFWTIDVGGGWCVLGLIAIAVHTMGDINFAQHNAVRIDLHLKARRAIVKL
jgi:hypothetical protein